MRTVPSSTCAFVSFLGLPANRLLKYGVASLVGQIAGSRARELRQRHRISTAELAGELSKAGVPWTQAVVEEFEEGRRGHLDVQELFAIAVVLAVPPVALLVDPSVTTTAVTPNSEVPTAYALLWLLGEQPLHSMTGEWEQQTAVVRLARQFHQQMWRCVNAHTALQAIERLQADGSFAPAEGEARSRSQERQLFNGLIELRLTMRLMREGNIAVPRLIDQDLLVHLAKSRGLRLEVGAVPQASNSATDG